jgi:putative ABC transport system permease protein
MLTRIIRGSLMRRRRRKALSVAAVALGIAVATAVGTIALDVGDKVNHELRSFGANISVAPAADSLAITVGGVDYRPPGAGSYLDVSSLVNLKKIFWRHNIVAFAPFLYLPITANGQSAVLTGSWFDKTMQVDKKEVFQTGLKDLHPTWKVEGQWPSDQGAECLVGARLARRLGIAPGQEISVAVQGSSSAASQLTVRGVLETGGPEDDQLIASLATVQQWAHLEGKFRRAEVSALTKPEDQFARADVSRMNQVEFERWNCTPYVRSIAYQIEQAIPGAAAKPVYQVADTEGKILDRVGILMWVLAAAALLTAGLAVSSMMLATVLERRAEIGLFKSLGATDARVATFFMLEAAGIGLAGGLLGYIAGSLLAQRLSLDIFGLPASVHWVFLPAALALALVVTLAGSALPLGHDLKLSPALVLRNE